MLIISNILNVHLIPYLFNLVRTRHTWSISTELAWNGSRQKYQHIQFLGPTQSLLTCSTSQYFDWTTSFPSAKSLQSTIMTGTGVEWIRTPILESRTCWSHKLFFYTDCTLKADVWVGLHQHQQLKSLKCCFVLLKDIKNTYNNG